MHFRPIFIAALAAVSMTFVIACSAEDGSPSAGGQRPEARSAAGPVPEQAAPSSQGGRHVRSERGESRRVRASDARSGEAASDPNAPSERDEPRDVDSPVVPAPEPAPPTRDVDEPDTPQPPPTPPPTGDGDS
jgi:hypothetical protein